MKTTISILKQLKNTVCASWIILLIGITCNTVSAQQEPTYTQYMFNTQTINPAYAGTWESMGFMVLAREQWVGIDGAPSTQTLSFQTPLRNERVGLGLNVINDKFGKEKRLTIFSDYSYLVQVDEELKLRLGLKIGFSNYSHNLNNYELIDETDPTFQGEIDQKFLPNFGVGAFLYKERFYAGVSIPKVVKNDFKNNYNNYSTEAEIRHLYLMGGYVFDISPNLKFKPTMLGKLTAGAPAQLDFTANFLIKEQFWLGTMYRTGDAVGFLAQWIINRNLRLGYAVDFATSGLSNYQNGTHEVMISYELKFLTEEFVSPRNF